MRPWQWIALAAGTLGALWFLFGRGGTVTAAPATSTATSSQSGPPPSVISPTNAPTPAVTNSPWLYRALGIAAPTNATPTIRTTSSTPGHQSAAGWYA